MHTNLNYQANSVNCHKSSSSSLKIEKRQYEKKLGTSDENVSIQHHLLQNSGFKFPIDSIFFFTLTHGTLY
ncbi:hypothetical protein DERP_006846 [Dermatophagoides pteronyssinus]|uniref:Uncharacterized protein n=1 Tax=Dermatophagoides pteronyssinus TaxID=6956 RepID=A0ABQ8ISX4_DERPT|nr:hypothetical protein DERP_006846 [Dermatophagoides pteronyssinus]